MKHRFKRQSGRPRLRRQIRFNPKVNYFKPQGVPMRDLDVVVLSQEEIEALRLKNIEDLSQIECAESMKTSQSTFQRILSSAYKKISLAIVKGQAICIGKM
ncbi:DUF134 domain-containing protein [Candidatus Parcubacteria bacterium]|nr:DUF134 domain-containing protein [Candidatus Parcubacteria bacterium]